jgi:hypothetical protein
MCSENLPRDVGTASMSAPLTFTCSKAKSAVTSLTNIPFPGREAKTLPRWMLIVMTVLSVAVALVSLRYFIPSVPMPSSIQANAFRNPWLLIHVAGAVTALMLGPAQFFPRLRARFPWQHRWTGRVYVVGCMIGGVSGLMLAVGTSTGSVSMVGFGSLALAWLVATILAWRRAVQRRLAEHQAWMIRSFALTLAAVTLRIYLPLSGLLPVSFESSYQAISFLCWVPNIMLAELYLRWRS